MAGITFSIPANDGSAGHATTQTSLFVHVPSAPGALTTIFDYSFPGGGYYRLRLGTDRHLQLEFSHSGYGTATADLGALPVSTWMWVSCGFRSQGASAGGLAIRGDVTPQGGATATATAPASSGGLTGTTVTNVAFGIGVTQSSAYSGFPNGAGWGCAKLIVDQIGADSGAGNPRPIPTSEPAVLTSAGEYLAHEPLGAAAALHDSGTTGLDALAGAQGLTINAGGPALLGPTGGAPGAHEGDLQYFHGGAWIPLPIGTTGQELTVVAGDPAWATPPSAGSVTSVAFAGPTGTSVSGSPITSSGTITLSWASQSANTFLGAPSGSSGAPTFRALVGADIPVDASTIVSSAGTITGNYQAGSGVSISGNTISATGSGGTVTSVALSMPGIFSVSGSPITGSGTVAVTLANESANTVFAGPTSGSAAAPTFRAVQPADLPAAPTAGGHVHAHGHFL